MSESSDSGDDNTAAAAQIPVESAKVNIDHLALHSHQSLATKDTKYKANAISQDRVKKLIKTGPSVLRIHR